MPGGKEQSLSIVIKTVDQATGPLRHVGQRLERMVEPARRATRAMRRLGATAGRGLALAKRGAAGLAKVLGGLSLAAGGAVYAFKGMVEEGDKLAKTADRVGVTVDALAQLRFAAGQSGVDVVELDKGLEGFTRRLGEAKAGTGSLTTFLNKASPALLEQLTAAKNSEEAFLLLSDAMAKLKDPAKEAALANAAFGRSGVRIVNLIRNGRKPVEELMSEFEALAGRQEESARGSEKIVDAMGRMSAVSKGLKASLITGLTPALLQLAKRAEAFFLENRGRINAWVRDFGEKLPDRIAALGRGLMKIGEVMGWLLDHAKELALIFGAIKVGGIIGGISQAAGAFGGLAGAINPAMIGLGLFAAAAVRAANKIDREQEDDIQKDNAAKQARRNLLGKFSGRQHGASFAQEKGLVDATGRVNLAAIRDAITPHGVRRSERGARRARRMSGLGSVANDLLGGSFTMNRVVNGMLSERETGRAAANIIAGQQQRAMGRIQKATVEVQFRNAPPGMTATPDPRSTADVDTAVDYQLPGAQ